MQFKAVSLQIKKFIIRLKHIVKVYIDKVISIHTFLKKTTEASMYENWKTTDRNLYSMFLGWLLENIIMIGSMITIGLWSLFGFHHGWYSFLMPIMYGCLYWLFIESIKRISQAIRSKER